jgi:hypothetical protein
LIVFFFFRVEAQMPCLSTPKISAVTLAAYALMVTAPAMAANGIDTASGVTNLPFNIEGVPVMTMTQTGLGIGVGTAGPIEKLEVSSGDSVVGANVYINGTGAQGVYIQALDTSANAQASVTYADNAGLALTGLAATAGRLLQSSAANEFVLNNRAGPIVLSADAGFDRQDLVITTSGDIGFGTTNPSGRIDSETGGANLWAGMFNYNAGNPTGAYGVYAYGTSYGVYGQTVNNYAVEGNATGAGWGVFGQSASSWAGVFEGAGGVYARSAGGGFAGTFNAQDSQNGVYITNNNGNAQLCLNGQCVTTLSSVPSGTWCGLALQMYCSGSGSGIGEDVTPFDCQGYAPTNGCPSGYSQAHFQDTTGSGRASNCYWTCVKN